MKKQITKQSKLQRSLSEAQTVIVSNWLCPIVLFLLMGNLPVFSQNPIVNENALSGNPPSEWEIYGEDWTIQGFATELGVNKGNTVFFKIDVDPAVNFTMKIYRVGYYQGNGARMQADLGTIQGIAQPDPLYDPNTGLTDCSNWSVSAQWNVPASAVSGIYFAKMVRANGGQNHITFVVRDDEGNSPILYKTSDGTWQAYNMYGDHSLYCGPISGNQGSFSHAVKVSYQRPFITRFVHCVGGYNEWYRNAEYPLIRWMERNGYHVSYTTQLDMSRNTTPITPAMHKIIISAGHDEYWSAECRTAWETARNNGVNLCFMSGNEVYWKTRWEDDYKTLVCYKEGTMGEYICGGNCDPTLTWTGLWRDGCGLNYTPYAIDGCNNENQLTGQMSWIAAETAIQVPATYKTMRFWKNTAIANLTTGQTLTLTGGSLGREWDFYQYAETYPPRRILLSETYASGRLHHLSLYRHSSGALVFGAGSEQWSWGLDANHDRGPSVEDINIQQATVNLFAYMGVPPDPANLQSGLYPEMGVYSTTPPITVITSPLNGSTLQNSTVSITGTASAPEGAVLFGVEVSVDGGTTWYTASGTTNWTFSWNPNQQGTHIIQSRGWDDLGNMEAPGPIGSSNCISVTFNGPSMYSVFLPNQPSGSPANSSGNPLEIGMKFKSSADGYITALKYYKNAGTTGEHIGNLWTASGTNLATVIFTNETTFGWQVAFLPTPVPVTANTIYIVSYFSPSGQFAYTTPYFTSDVTNFLLTAPASTASSPNGVYKYTPTSSFPNGGAYNPSYNYWADINFSTTLGPDTMPPSVIAIYPLNNATGVTILAIPSATFGEALDPATVNNNTFFITDAGANPVAGTVNYTTGSSTATFTPSVHLAYSATFTVTLVGGDTDPRIKDLAGNALEENFVWTFTTENLYTPSITVHPASQSACAGSTVSFFSSATGNPPPTLQWQVSTDNGNTWTDIEGATTSPLSFAVVTEDDGKQFHAVWTNSGGSEISNPAILTVIGAISVTIEPVNDSICPGDPFQLQLTQATGLPPYTLVINGKTYSGVATGQGSIFATIPTADETIWSPATTPATISTSSTPYELGVKFKARADGYIKGIRFHKGEGNAGTHVGRLWTSTGTLLASATFTDETPTGWQQVLFSSPVSITANTVYVASYSDPAGHFSLTMPYFNNNPVISANGLLETIPSPAGSPANGVYSTTLGTFPNTVYNQSPNYWVDVVYTYSVDSQTVTNNLTSVSDNGTCTITGNPISCIIVHLSFPDAPVVSSPVYCIQGSVAVPLTATGANLLWYTTPIGGTGSPEAPIPSTSVIGTTSYYVSQTVDGCESPRAQIDVIVITSNVPPPVVTSPVYYIQGATAVPLTAVGVNLLWYTTPTGGTGSPVAPTPSTAVLGTTSYYVSQTIEGIESPRVQIDVIVTPEGDWFDLNWLYRRPVAVSNPAGISLTDYQVLISLDNSFDFTKANIDGSDIRVTDVDGITQIPFWIESWDSIALQAKIWIKMPSIPINGTTAFLYYRNPAANTLSDGISTFKLFDDTWQTASGNLNPVHVATQPWWEGVVSYPIVFEDNSFPDRPRFHMLYDGHNVIGHAKGYATSPNLINWTSWDNGLSGNARINPVMGVGYAGGTQFAWGDFIKIGTVYHMLVSGGPGTTVHCQSTDLLHWTNSSGGSATFDPITSDDPSGIGTGVAILKEADGITPVIIDSKYWIIYFHGFSGGSMYMAYSDASGDLLSWTRCYGGSPVLTPSGWEGSQLWTPSFTKVNDKYYIYYQGGSPYKIGFASAPSTSGGNPVRPDQSSWTKSPNNPVITNTHGWDNGFCQDPVLRCFDGVYYIFYTGDPPWTNGFAYSNSPEGPWIQYGQTGGGQNIWAKTGNPIVSNGIMSFASGQSVKSLWTYSPGNAIGFRANLGPQGGNENRWGGFINGTGGSTPPDRAIIQKQVTPYAPDNNHAFLSTHPTYSELSLLDNQFHVYEVLWGSGRADAVLDHGATSIFTTSNVPSASIPVTLYNLAGTSPLQVDWVFVRQYISPEPTTAVGNEQIQTQPPVADFMASTVTLNVGQTVTFSDLSTNTPTSWLWSFAPATVTYVEGTSATSQNPQLQFNSGGLYTVTLTATNATGSDNETKTDYILVTAPPIADFLADITEPGIGQTVSFTDLSINDPTLWAWSFTPSTVTFVGGTNDLSQNPQVQFYAPGNYTVQLTVSNAAGIDLETKIDYVAVIYPPVADFIADNTSPVEGEGVFFTDLSTNNPITWSWIFTPATVTYIDGTTSGSQNPHVQFEVPGLYQVELTVTNASGSDTATKPDYILVQNATFDLEITVYLEGPFNGTNMTPNLNGILPFNQPYNVSPWNYPGTESVVAIPNSNIVDWVLVELRDAADAASANGATRMASQAAFLLNDGMIVGLDGTSTLQFNNTLTQYLFAVIWHRNHLGVMSSESLTETGGIYSYDFTTAAEKAYGGTFAMKQIASGIWGMMGGDGNPDGDITSTDKSPIWDIQSGTMGYLESDYNLDTQSNNKDKDDIWVPNLGSGSQVPD